MVGGRVSAEGSAIMLLACLRQAEYWYIKKPPMRKLSANENANSTEVAFFQMTTIPCAFSFLLRQRTP